MSSFTYKHYRKTIEDYLTNGYEVTDFSRVTSGKQLILRHDVDMDLSLSDNMSMIEHDLSVPSIYFIRIHAKNYNALSVSSVKTMQKIASRGQEIGFHYEPTFTSNENHEEAILEGKALLEKIAGVDIRYYSLHEPARTGLDMKKVLPDMNRSFGVKFYEDFKYLSDSSARWREGCFSEHVNKWEKIIVLTHPFWWYNKSSGENY